MTVSSSTNRASYSGNGSLTTFAYGFKVFDQDDLTVILRASNGTETVQTITTDYTVTGVGDVGGGNVVFVTAPASGVTVVILREMDLEQGLDLVPNDPFPAQSLENSLDKLTFMVQQHSEQLGRAIKASRTNVLSGSEFVISAADRANKVFSFDGSGDLAVTQELGTFQGNWATATVYQVRDIVKDTSTNNIFIVNTEHTSSGAQPLTTNANSAKYDLIVDAAAAATSATAAASSATDAETAQTASEAAQAAAEAAQASAETAETNAETAETNAETAQAAAEAAQAAAELVYDNFDDRYLGAKSTSGGDPTLDNDGDALIDGALFFDTTNNVMKVYNLGTTAWLRTTPTTSDQTNINTVSGIQANVTTVAGISSDVTSVAGISADVTTVAADGADIGTVAGISANVTTVAGISSDVTTVAGNSTNINTVAGQTTNLQNVTDNLSAIQSASANAVSAATSATAASDSAAAAAASFDSFDDKYLGSKTGYADSGTGPTVDNDGNALVEGALFFSSDANEMRVYDGANWIAASSAGSASLILYEFTATSGQTTFSGADDNGATLGYTIGNAQFVLNGVILDPSDFTATNGTSVVLASGAATGDLLNVYAFKSFTVADTVSASAGGTFAGNVTFNGAFTSQGIDDNADAVALTIDSSENVLIGKTATGGNVAGMQIINGSFFSHVRDGGVVQVLNRKSSDGDILSFEKDNSTVGSIGTEGGRLQIGKGASGLYFYDSGPNLLPWNVSTNTVGDGTVDLGASSARFKDLYLSGGVFLGGVGSSNLLDDYEEGTFSTTVTVGGGSVTTSSAGGIYTKIGDVVHLQGTLVFSSVSSPTGFINLTLPFTPNSTYISLGVIVFENSVSKDVRDFAMYIRPDLGSARIYIADVNVLSSSGANAQEIDASTSISFTLTYKL